MRRPAPAARAPPPALRGSSATPPASTAARRVNRCGRPRTRRATARRNNGHEGAAEGLGELSPAARPTRPGSRRGPRSRPRPCATPPAVAIILTAHRVAAATAPLATSRSTRRPLNVAPGSSPRFYVPRSPVLQAEFGRQSSVAVAAAAEAKAADREADGDAPDDDAAGSEREGRPRPSTLPPCRFNCARGCTRNGEGCLPRMPIRAQILLYLELHFALAAELARMTKPFEINDDVIVDLGGARGKVEGVVTKVRPPANKKRTYRVEWVKPKDARAKSGGGGGGCLGPPTLISDMEFEPRDASIG
mmetsp:Transcript_105707/g.305653  ORF Transcript_105707/g.305653 Transcript_105707/m.305653 type:complete len:305 (-) Transcript_105707:1224-2138(-)